MLGELSNLINVYIRAWFESHLLEEDYIIDLDFSHFHAAPLYLAEDMRVKVSRLGPNRKYCNGLELEGTGLHMCLRNASQYVCLAKHKRWDAKRS
ncbi:uncharacterized protein K452DRAFT_63671 [Aplosporella prunicola CBS 121167]|uniref:Uncharacterized protein n=1 Tax=Aplosporella prunicola CBS 121167 TaxID=1176127 RepID=A0A6A6B6L1_9PEZI|nr:uncharacterized protein K452DRAFT_63671 [Aplosporella prunicola CBS 121167]KAF2139650.1 hypothetical protein K452DRAFT_63671 [Aplosporella prunicola CBS 121167]